MNIEYEVIEDASKIRITVGPDDDVDALALRFFDCATPTFKLEEDGSLVAVLETPLR